MPFNNANDPEMIAKSAAVAEAFTPQRYAYLLSLLPTPEGFTELHNRFEAGYPGVLKGDAEKVEAFEADRQAVIADLSLILGLAKVVAVKDPTVPESLGLSRFMEKTAAVQTPLTACRDFKIFFDPKGQLFASVSRLPGAKGYQLWGCDGDPSVEANWRLVTSSTSCKAILITGLNRSKFNVLRIRAMRGREAGPWSNWISLEPI
ncbi:MAG TPA: hypothetical protein DCZ75_03805 [Geobacter sp.]|nr:hypothetical protein [Geobacter sp.]